MACTRTLPLLALLSGAALIGAGATPKPHGPAPKATPAPSVAPVTDANVAERVLSARSKDDELALADYYKAKAQAEDARIEYFDHLFRAYMKLEGKIAEPLQHQSRMLLKAARMSKQRYLLLSQAHRNIAWEVYAK